MVVENTAAGELGRILATEVTPVVIGLTLGYYAMKDRKISKEAKRLGMSYKEYKKQLKITKLKGVKFFK